MSGDIKEILNLSSLNKILITGAKGYIGSFLIKYLANKGFRAIRFVQNLNKISELPECDLIVHCAGRRLQKGVTISDFVRDNVTATINLTKLANGKPIIYLSTKAVYVFKPYGITKLLGEFVLTDEYKNAVVLRLPKIIDGRTEPENIEHAISIGLENLGDWIVETINSLPVKD
jgi:nucleoside-diphosphate-sugar epimerase